MKKIMMIICVLSLIIGLSACDEKDQELLGQLTNELQDVVDLADDLTNSLKDKVTELEESGQLEQLEELLSEDGPLAELADTLSGLENIASSSQTNTAYDDWADVVGYWHAAEGRYFLLDMEDSHTANVGQGFHDTSNYREGKVIELTSENQILTAKVIFPERAATEESEGVPETEVIFTIDTSDKEQDGKIRIQLNDENTFQCAFAGSTFTEAYQTYCESMGVQIEKTVYEEWSELVGYWNAAEGRYFLLDMEDSHTAYLGQGFHETENQRMGKVIQMSSNHQVITATVLFPERKPTEEIEGVPATEVVFLIDYSDKEQDGKIRIQIKDENIFQCAFAGNTMDEAHQMYLDNN